MKAVAVVEPDGRIDRVCVSSDDTLPVSETALEPGQILVELPELISPFEHYWDGERVQAMPARPGQAYDFDFATRQWVRNDALAWALVRAERDRLLAESDWVVARANEWGEPVPAEWRAYRQALRDVTQQADPSNIDWPTPPTG